MLFYALIICLGLVTERVSAVFSPTSAPSKNTAASITAVATDWVTRDVFTVNSNQRVTVKWLEAGQLYADDSSWTTVTTKLASFVSPVVLLSLPDFGGNTYSSGSPLSLRIRNKQFIAGNIVSFEVKVNALHLLYFDVLLFLTFHY